jgi:hypothetical protein
MSLRNLLGSERKLYAALYRIYKNPYAYSEIIRFFDIIYNPYCGKHFDDYWSGDHFTTGLLKSWWFLKLERVVMNDIFKIIYVFSLVASFVIIFNLGLYRLVGLYNPPGILSFVRYLGYVCILTFVITSLLNLVVFLYKKYILGG